MSKHPTEKHHNSNALETETGEIKPEEIDDKNNTLTESATYKSSNKTYIYIGVMTLVLISIGIGFYFYQQNQAKNNASNLNGRGNGQRTGVSRTNLSTVMGKVASVSDKNLIIDVVNNGGQKIIILSETSTQISKTEETFRENVLKIDQTITVEGDKNGDSITAKIITTRETSITNPQNPENQAQMPNPAMMQGGGSNVRTGSMTSENQNPITNDPQNFVFGKISEIDGDKVTIQSQARPTPQNNNQAGNNTATPTTTTIIITNDTKFNHQNSLEISDIKDEQTVTIAGMTDASGSIVARSVIIE